MIGARTMVALGLAASGLLSIGTPTAEAGPPFITASPNPLVITKPYGGGPTKLTYDSGDGTRARISVRIDGVDIGVQHSDTDSTGTYNHWISLGKTHTFRLYAVTVSPNGTFSSKLVASVSVKGEPGGCLAQCVRSVNVLPSGTFADISVVTKVATSLLVSVCLKPTGVDGKCNESVPFPWVGFSLTGKTWHKVRAGPIGKLKPDTTYYYGVIAKDASGNLSVSTGTFRTKLRRVTIHFDRIRVIDDSDDTGAGELLFGFFAGKPGDAFYRTEFRSGNGWNSGGTYIPNRRLMIDGAPTTIPILVVGRDDDVGFGVLNSCGPPSWFPEEHIGPSDDCNPDGFEYGWKHFAVDLSPRENAEAFTDKFLYVSNDYYGGVRFTVRGRAIVQYISR